MNARKYKLNISNVISCGVGTHYSDIIEYNVLNSFTVGSCTYNTITTDTLKTLPKIQYEKRVIDYLDSLNIDSEIAKDRLYNESSFFEPECTSCKLNPDFIVYKFLTGIRIINIGTTYGIAQYKVYPTSENSTNYQWVTNPTFLNLDQNQVYNVLVRDYFENNEVCRVSTVISMPTLIPSTTIAPQIKTIKLYQTSLNNLDNTSYAGGYIQILPPLQSFESMNLNYIANFGIVNNGTSCVQFTCKPNGASSFVTQNCLTNTNGDSPRSGSIPIRYGDTICYDVVSNAYGYGSLANANYCISSIDGLGTITPSIDISNCSVSVTKEIQPVVTIVSFTDKLTTTSLARDTINGCVSFSQPIPSDQSVTIQFLVENLTAFGTSRTTFSCKPNGVSTYSTKCAIDNTITQPGLSEITLQTGDQMCYDIILDTPNYGSASEANICFNILSGTQGIIPLKDDTIDGSSVFGRKIREKIAHTVSVCRNLNEQLESNGYINLEPTLSSTNQYFIANFETSQIIDGAPLVGGGNNIKIFCKANNSSTFNEIYDFSTLYLGQQYNDQGILTFRLGDVICYSNSITYNLRSESMFTLTNVSSSNDIAPMINLNGKDRDVLIK